MKSEKTGFEPLHSKLQLLQDVYGSKVLFEQWKQAKEMRNSFAHREAGGRLGILLLKGFKHNLNMINSVFLEPETIKRKENEHEDLVKKTEHLIEGLFVLEYNESRILVLGTRPFTTGIIKNNGQSLWAFIPITGNNAIKTTSDLPSTIILKLKNVEIHEKGLNAEEVITNQKVLLTSTEKVENMEKLMKHNSQMNEAENLFPNISVNYMATVHSSLLKEVGNFLYEDWE